MGRWCFPLDSVPGEGTSITVEISEAFLVADGDNCRP